MKKQKGIVTNTNRGGGFGFITAEDGACHFFHVSGCITAFEDLREGHTVEFIVIEIPKGTKAIGVTLVEPLGTVIS